MIDSMVSYVWLLATGLLIGYNLMNLYRKPEKSSYWLWTGVSLAVFAAAVIQLAKVLP